MVLAEPLVVSSCRRLSFIVIDLAPQTLHTRQTQLQTQSTSTNSVPS